jgi:hypothetical protein
MPALAASLVFLAALAVTPFAGPSNPPTPRLALAPRSAGDEPPAPTLQLAPRPPAAALPPPSATAEPPPSATAEPPPSATAEPPPSASAEPPPSAPTPTPAAEPQPVPDSEPAPASDLAAIEAEHAEDEPAESLALQPAAPEAMHGRARPRVWGSTWLSLSILAGRYYFGLGGGVVRFVVPRLGFGLDVADAIVLDRVSYNLFRLTPKVVFLVLPYRRVTPLASAGFGGAFYSHGGGAYGRWVAGGGVMFAIREHLRMGFGLDVAGHLPKDRFYQRFRCTDGEGGCHIGVAPWVSFGWRG